jgi:hypothetical protein
MVRLDKNYYRRKKEPIISGGELDPRIATRDCERGTRITARVGTRNWERGTRITARVGTRNWERGTRITASIRTRLVKVGQEPMNRV